MPTISERVRDIRSTYRTDNNLDPKLATIVTKNGQMQVQGLPNHYWVSYPTSNGLSTVRPVGGPAKVLPLKPGVPVILERFRGKLRIKEVDPERALASATDISGDLQYRKDSSTPQGRFETLRLIPKGGLILSLRSWMPDINGTYKEFSYPDIDVSSNVPSAGQMRYATVFVKADLATIEVVNSTARGVTDVKLGVDDVNECKASASSGSTGAWAVKLIGGQTEITQDDIDNDARDLRQLVNTVDRTMTVRVVAAAGAITVTTADYTIIVNKSVGAATTVNLPASPATGLTFVIKDGKGDANTNNITITPAAGNIDGAGTHVMNVARSARIVQYTGSEWAVIGGYL